ncbi:MAG TPA: 2-dehydropantoate 2-reductase [Casimicrobiaceae bacterium]|nr:2-dehydropantoate 2-reductase [Casimicrobiaceae bacterium]
MRIAVMGAGGVGGYFGTLLARAGHDVAFVARGRHLAAMRERGLRVRGSAGEILIERPTVSDGPSALGVREVVLFAVKLWDTESAADAIRPMLDAKSVVIPFQNGVESVERIGRIVGARHVMGGAAYIAATIAEPGVIIQTGSMARLRFGAVIPEQRDAGRAFLEACTGAGIDAELADDIERVLWEKFVFLSAMSGTTAATRQPIGAIRDDPDLRAVLEAAMREAHAVGRTRGAALGEGFVEQQLAFADGLPAQMRSSMLNDLLAGNRLEAPWLSGAVARMAKEAGLDAPVSATLYAAVKPFCGGGR